MSTVKYDTTDQATQSLQKRGYKILSKINQGSYAKVYLAEFTSALISSAPTTTKLAVKILEAKRKPSEFVKKFLAREIYILSQIDHPHIIHIHSILKIGLKFYVFMRFAELGDLLDYMIKNGRINENQARVWTRQIALAIQYLHLLHIAHRDLKCENVLVTINYNVKLSDFGFARYTIDLRKKPIMSETYCGTLLYASPEILHGKPYNPISADLWSLGVVIYAMLNKSLPFDDNNPKMLYQHQINHNFKFRSKVEEILSGEVKKLVESLLEPEPLKRCSIENVINSAWIAMDTRLQKLSPMEQAALSIASTHQITPPASFLLPNFQIEQTNLKEISEEEVYDIEDIKPYTESKQRISADSRLAHPNNL